MNISEIGNTMGDFTWCWGQSFFIETDIGNFIWSSSDYGGDNTITKYFGSLADFYKLNNIGYGRCKGKHIIFDYCGNGIELAT